MVYVLLVNKGLFFLFMSSNPLLILSYSSFVCTQFMEALDHILHCGPPLSILDEHAHIHVSDKDHEWFFFSFLLTLFSCEGSQSKNTFFLFGRFGSPNDMS